MSGVNEPVMSLIEQPRNNGNETRRRYKPVPPIEHQFKPGNPGRPKGSRNRLAEKFWTDLYGAWQERGKEAIQRMIDDDPGGFVKVVASQMPKELLLKAESLDDLSDEDILERLELLRSFANRAIADRTAPVIDMGEAPGEEEA